MLALLRAAQKLRYQQAASPAYSLQLRAFADKSDNDDSRGNLLTKIWK